MIKVKQAKRWNLLLLGDLDLAEELAGFFLGLEAAVTELGCSIDPFEVDIFGGDTAGVDVDGLTEGDGTLDSTSDGALDH